MSTSKRRHIVIVGGGFGGINAARVLRKSDAKITLIDKTNHHLFQPLLYQVATAALSPGDIAAPIRDIVGKNLNIDVLMGEVERVNPDSKSLLMVGGRTIQYDQLILAPGSQYNYFQHDAWEEFAPGLKTIGDALQIRERILLSLEEADQIDDPTLREPFLTFVIIGGGPTGVEMAGAIAEIAKRNMLRDFRNISPNEVRIFLVEAAPTILNAFSESLSAKAVEILENMGVRVLLNTPVTEIHKNSVSFKKGSISTPNIIWAAGVLASPLLKTLGAEMDRTGRVMVQPDLSVPGHPEIFVIGDGAYVEDKNGVPLPALAPVAMQQGEFIGKLLKANKSGGSTEAVFNYLDKGTMATIGRAKAVADIRGLKFSGFIAWFLWSFVHILFLIGFRNRFRVFAEWMWYYFSFKRGVRLITGRKG
ncbi:MAG TPA: FAD-dependent oxidoreductase [Bacteroidetes bacterium]|nr:FAD-dependent oxidoreductase [Bacteroidota bacterium]